jgi:hypothetical protein
VQGRANGKERRVTIGQHGKPISETETLTADKARKLAMGLIASLSKGIDPVIENERKETLAVTLSEVCTVYLAERQTKKGGNLTPRTKADYKRHVEVSFQTGRTSPLRKSLGICVRRDSQPCPPRVRHKLIKPSGFCVQF